MDFFITVCIAEVGDFIAGPAPAEMLIRKVIIKLPNSFLGKVKPRTKAAMLLQLMFQCPAPILAMHCCRLLFVIKLFYSGL
jgi:hypothetical protein